MRNLISVIATVLLIVGLPACAASKSKPFPIAEGYVLETETNRPIADAYVYLTWDRRTKYVAWAEVEVVVKTNAQGYFSDQAPAADAYGWELLPQVYLPGYQMYPYRKSDHKTLRRMVDKFDSDNVVERTPEQMRALGYQREPPNKLTFTGWFEQRPLPKWYQSPKKGQVIIYMERANMSLDQRVQEIAWTGAALGSVKQRLGPLLEFDRMRFTEATNLICSPSLQNAEMSTIGHAAYWHIFADWQRRVHNAPNVYSPTPLELVSETKRLWALTDQAGGGAERQMVFGINELSALCAIGKYYLESVKS